jgi:hypothetical protein
MSRWVCQICKLPIAPGEPSTIAIFNSNFVLGPVGSYPIERSPSMRPARRLPRLEDEPLLETADAELVMARLEPSIEFVVRHGRCKGTDLDDAYSFYPPDTLEEWLAWVAHVGVKGWMGKEDVLRMLSFWWTHQGQRSPEPMRFGANYFMLVLSASTQFSDTSARLRGSRRTPRSSHPGR